MSLTQKRINQIIKEELDRALSERGMNEMTDDDYNEYIQQQHGRFTTPENMPGTREYSARLAAGRPPMTPAAAPPYRSEHPAHHHYQRQFDELDDYIATGRLPMREADDDMDMDADTGIDVVPDDAMSGEDTDMGPEAMMEPLEQEIDWSQFEDDDADAVGAAFLDAVKQLKEENPDESPTAEAVVALMQELLAADDLEDMGDEEPGAEESEDEAPMGDEEEGVMQEWVRRTNLLAGTSKRR